VTVAVAVSFAQRVDAFDGDAAKGEVVGELPIGDSECRKVVAASGLELS